MNYGILNYRLGDIIMAWEEYIDLIEKANKKDTKYVLYSLDGVHADRESNHKDFLVNSHILMRKMTEIFLNMDENILVNERPICIDKSANGMEGLITYYNNPNFTHGDLISFYFYREKISDELFKKVFSEAYEYTSKQFRYHLSKCNYETNNYASGNRLLYVGYALGYINDCKDIRKEILGNKINIRR